MKCFVCTNSVKAEDAHRTVFLSSGFKYICSFSCYQIYIKEYSLAELNVTLTQMEERLKSYRKEKGGTK